MLILLFTLFFTSDNRLLVIFSYISLLKHKVKLFLGETLLNKLLYFFRFTIVAMPRQHSTSVFQEQWLTDPLFINWLKKSAKDGQYAYCFLCLKDISVYNMGRQSLLSHMKSKKHKEKLLVMQKTVDIRAQLSSPKSTSENYIPEPIPQANDSEKSFQV